MASASNAHSRIRFIGPPSTRLICINDAVQPPGRSRRHLVSFGRVLPKAVAVLGRVLPVVATGEGWYGLTRDLGSAQAIQARAFVVPAGRSRPARTTRRRPPPIERR